MLYFINNRGDTLAGWHVGEPVPLHRNQLRFAVEIIQADSDEKEHIKHKFPNLPISNGLTVTYIGEMAKFIAINL